MNPISPSDSDRPDVQRPDAMRPDGQRADGQRADAARAVVVEPDDGLLLEDDLDPALLDGHTVDELTDYLDAGMLPADPSIDDSPVCQNALAAIARVRAASRGSLDAAALDEAPADDSWVGRILSNISMEARAGRDIPFRSTAPTQHGVITEGTVRSLLRRAGDTVDGLLIGRCALEGDVTVVGEPIRVRITASVLWGNPIHEAVDRLRTAVTHELLEHTELVVEAIDVEIRDVLLDRAPVAPEISATEQGGTVEQIEPPDQTGPTNAEDA
ncbi:Asp23/Gls24 family envelope stress response protein [Curtobacterium sp. Leaf261]|uniref:Asp23/Gls24 family envelope stress response protein n=1 Tax=Curtobacterium sp. Leaf261 TaxID=1736311 RepID=UPI000A808393|nr:Asp23/Gls24 family envelope stress response protein [Curtobacterium sp. Leaf261]